MRGIGLWKEVLAAMRMINLNLQFPVLVAAFALLLIFLNSSYGTELSSETKLSFSITEGIDLIISTTGDYRPMPNRKLYLFEYKIPLVFQFIIEEEKRFSELRLFLDYGDGEGLWLQKEDLSKKLIHLYSEDGISRICYPVVVAAIWREGESLHVAVRSIKIGEMWFGDDEPTFAPTLAPPASSDDPVVDAVLRKLHQKATASPDCQPASD